MPENLHPTIKWSAQHPNPLEENVKDILWQIVNRKQNLNSNLGNSMIKASDSFTAAKGSVPLLYKIITPTSTKCKADDQNELHTMKKLRTFCISGMDAIKCKNEMGQTDQRKNKN